jgi:PAS domain S-box-containing protein
VSTRTASIIAIVDDNAETRDATARVLASAGFRVIFAETGADALKLAPESPDLILLGVSLPDLHGFEVCRRLRQTAECRTTPIIHLSSSCTSSQDQAQGMNQGADAYLVHPIEPQVLVATVRAFLRAKEAEARLRESEARFRRMFDTAPAMLCTVDATGNVRLLSGEWNEYTGRTESDGRGAGWLDSVHPSDRDTVASAVRSAAQQRSPVSIDCRIRSRTGTYRWFAFSARPTFDASGVFEGLVGCLIDVHDRKLVEAALQESEEKFRNLADNMSQSAWMADHMGSVFWFNRRWLDFTGSTLPEMHGWGWSEALHPEHASRILAKYCDHIGRGVEWEDVIPLRAATGTYRWFLSRAVPIRDADGRIVRWFGTHTDITDQKQAEEERAVLLDSERTARAQLDRASRMKDEFLGTLSHELRTPLNATLGWTHLLRRDPRPELVAQGIEVIDRNARIQNQLIADLLDISRVISGKFRLDVQTVSLARIVDAALESVRHAADARNIAVEVRLDPALGENRGDPARLQQVIWNLLSNAIKFTPEGGRVWIDASPRGSEVELSIRDSGKGIPPDLLTVIFDRFRQADASSAREFGGLGIGLALVKQIVELHGGRVRADSDGPGCGAIFTVTLPAIAGPHRDDTTSGSAAARDAGASGGTGASSIAPLGDAPALDGISILLVDDEPDALDTLSRLLLECNATVVPADGAQQALAILKREQCDLIISDIAMPIFDGYEFMRHVRQSGYQMPSIALTAFSRESDRTQALQAGFQTHVAKPVEPAALLSAVAALVKTKRPPGPPTDEPQI